MKLNWKIILGGGAVLYVAEFILGMASGMVIHNGVLESIYDTTQEFWRPELNQDPPDMAALMPQWIAVGLLTAFVHAGIFDNIRSALNGSAMIKGLKFGLIIAIIYILLGASMAGVFNLPNTVWFWWSLEWLVLFPIAGIALGWFVGKYGDN